MATRKEAIKHCSEGGLAFCHYDAEFYQKEESPDDDAFRHWPDEDEWDLYQIVKSPPTIDQILSAGEALDLYLSGKPVRVSYTLDGTPEAHVYQLIQGKPHWFDFDKKIFVAAHSTALYNNFFDVDNHFSTWHPWTDVSDEDALKMFRRRHLATWQTLEVLGLGQWKEWDGCVAKSGNKYRYSY